MYEEVLPKHYIFNRSMELPGRRKKKRKRKTRRIEFGFAPLSRNLVDPAQSVNPSNHKNVWPELDLLNVRNIKKLSRMQRPRQYFCAAVKSTAFLLKHCNSLQYQIGPSVVLVAATVMILLAPGSTVPEDLSWEALRREFHNAEGFLRVVHDFDGGNIEKFKVRALQPFIVNKAFNPITLRKTSRTAGRFVQFAIQRVIKKV